MFNAQVLSVISLVVIMKVLILNIVNILYDFYWDCDFVCFSITVHRIGFVYYWEGPTIFFCSSMEFWKIKKSWAIEIKIKFPLKTQNSYLSKKLFIFMPKFCAEKCKDLHINLVWLNNRKISSHSYTT